MMANGATGSDMQTAQLGRNGPIVSRLGLGTMTFGAETPEAEAFRQMDLFVDRGGTLIDTADVYSSGISEEIIGRWGKQRGGLDDLIVATKCRFAPPPGSHGASRRAIVRSLEGSLRRLQVECIDLYYIHGWDRYTDVLETLSTLGDLVRAGKIHNIAWSNIAGWQLQKIVSSAQYLGGPRPVALQPHYNLLDRGIEFEVLPCCLEANVALVPWSPLGGGWLTGKYSDEARPTGATRLGEDVERGVEAYSKRNIPRTYAILDTVSSISKKHARPMSHVALAWLLSRPSVAAPLLGARTEDQLHDTLESVSLTLDPDDLVALNRVSTPGLPDYPYRFLEDWSDMQVWQDLGT